ncbi:MAG: cytidine deaminase [Bacteroidetes bacterium]|nr:cytidine deaminase [Bacteroidota bacterium]
MKKIQLISEFNSYENLEELPKNYFDLIQKAIEASQKAYAPYSNFNVGAALTLENNIFVEGSNQENAAYPSGICAERTALFYAGHMHHGVKILTLAVAANSEVHDTNEPVIPCGACLQVISEYERKQNSPITILLHGNNGHVIECIGVKNLMPMTFVLK